MLTMHHLNFLNEQEFSKFWSLLLVLKWFPFVKKHKLCILNILSQQTNVDKHLKRKNHLLVSFRHATSFLWFLFVIFNVLVYQWFCIFYINFSAIICLIIFKKYNVLDVIKKALELCFRSTQLIDLEMMDCFGDVATGTYLNYSITYH